MIVKAGRDRRLRRRVHAERLPLLRRSSCRWPWIAPASSGPIPGVAASSSASAARDLRERPEPLHQRLLSRGADARDVVQRRPERSFAPLRAVVAHREPVGLVAHVLEDEQRLRAPRDPQGVRRLGEVHLLQPLREADVRDRQPELREHLRGLRQLTAAPVHDDQRRRVREPAPSGTGSLVPFLQEPDEAPPEHLFHGSEVVLSGHSLDLEPSVVRSLREAVLEHDHGADRVGRPEVRDVVALDPERRLLEPEPIAQIRERPGPCPEVRGPPQLVSLERFLRVARDDLEQPPLGPAFGHPDLDPRSAAAGEPGLEEPEVGRRAGDQHPAAAPPGAPCRAAPGMTRSAARDRAPRRDRRPIPGDRARALPGRRRPGSPPRGRPRPGRPRRGPRGWDSTISCDSRARRAAKS